VDSKHKLAADNWEANMVAQKKKLTLSMEQTELTERVLKLDHVAYALMRQQPKIVGGRRWSVPRVAA